MLYLVFQPEKIEQPIQVKTKIPDTDYFMEGVLIHKFDASGKQINTLLADRMEHSSLHDISILDKPVITFANSRGGQWKLYSNSGELLNDNTVIRLKEEVSIQEHNIKNAVQTKITTKDLTIDLLNKNALTEEKVLIENKYYRTQSFGLEMLFDQEVILLKNKVSTEIYQ